MAEPLKFEFKLLDLMSNPASTIAKTLAAANKAMKEAKPAGDELTRAELKAAVAAAKQATETRRLATELAGYVKQLDPAAAKTKRLSVEAGNIFHSFAGLRRSAEGEWTLNLAEGLGAVVGVAQRLGGALYDITRNAAEVGAQSEKTGRAFRLNLGQAGGKDLLTYLDRVRDASRGLYTQAQLRELAAPLVQRGIGLSDIKRFLPASLSVETRGGSADAALGALGGVRTNRQVGVGTLEALGLGSLKDKQAIASQLGKQFGFGGGYAQRNPEAILAAVSERLAYQPKKTEAVINTLLNYLQKREGGALGNEAAAAQNSPAATLARLENLPTTITERLAASGVLTPLYAALNNFADAITGPQGKGLIDALTWFVDGAATWTNAISRWLGKESEADKIREAGGLALEDKSGRVTESYTAQQTFDLAKQALSARGEKVRSITDLPRETIESLALAQLRVNERTREQEYARAAAGQSGADQIELGRNIAIGMEQQRISSQGGVPASGYDGSADDFIWRDGKAIQIDPNDTVVGYKRGGSLGLGGSQSGGGGGMMLQIAPGAIVIEGAGKNADEIADVVLDKVAKGYATVLLSQFDQFAADVGA